MATVLPLFLLVLAAGEPPPVGLPTTVYRVHPGTDAPVMVGAALAIAVPTLLADELIRKRCPCDPSEIDGFDRAAVGNHSRLADVTSDATAVLALTAPPLLDLLDLGGGEAFRADAVIFAETVLVNGALVELAKVAVQRPLPRTYAGDRSLVTSPGGYRSFYSGHTSTVFASLTATAMTLRLRYGARWWPWVVDGVVGTSVAVERVAGGRHFPTDVIVGALAGTLVGIVVPALHAVRSPVTLVPSAGGLGIAIRLP